LQNSDFVIPNSSLKPGGSEVVQDIEHCTFRGATARWKGVVEHRFSARLEDGFHRPKDRKQAFSVQGQPGHEKWRFRQSPPDRQGFLMVVADDSFYCHLQSRGFLGNPQTIVLRFEGSLGSQEVGL